jgi:predicted HNH restriction endonuclease
MKEGETRRYMIPDDFMVLCPTCHRVIHKQVDASDLRQLKSSLNSGAFRGKKFFN